MKMKFSKLQIATIQLEQALKSYFEENYIVSITLGGASEEILGLLLKKEKNMDTSMDEVKNGTRKIYKKLEGEAIDERELHKLVTGVRNGLKHFQNGKDMEFDPQEEAIDVLNRAIDNYFNLTHDETELMNKFRKING